MDYFIKDRSMVQIYKASPRHILFSNILPIVVAIGGILVSIYLWSIYKEFQGLIAFLVIICVYTLYNSFFSKSYPTEIHVGDDHISFFFFKNKKTYYYEEFVRVRIKHSKIFKTMFIRIQTSKTASKRYWIDANHFNNSDILYKVLLELEGKGVNK